MHKDCLTPEVVSRPAAARPEPSRKCTSVPSKPCSSTSRVRVSQLPDFDDWAALLSEFLNVSALTVEGRRGFSPVIKALRTYKDKQLPRLFQLTACIAVKIDANTKADARAFGALLVERAERSDGSYSRSTGSSGTKAGKRSLQRARPLLLTDRKGGETRAVVVSETPTGGDDDKGEEPPCHLFAMENDANAR